MQSGSVGDRRTFAAPELSFARVRFCFLVLPWLLAQPLQAEPVSFQNDVMAVLSKAGCNAGSCHGNANGKAGFKLSLRGQDPEFDYNVLTRDAYARRTNPLDPDQSLMLLKPTTQVAHEGGQRFKRESEEYKIIRTWIESGITNDVGQAPKLEKLEVIPREQLLFAPTNHLQLQVFAEFSDGRRDITRFAVYESANSLAEISHDGLATLSRPGETTILVRYLDQQVAARVAFVPDRPSFSWHPPAERNYIDSFVFSKLHKLRIEPSKVCSDEVFIRRVTLDLAGLLPTAEEAKAFVADRRKDKRERFVQKTLDRPEFAEFWALKWSDLLRNEERVLDRKGSEAYYHWVRQSIAENKPLDQFVREILAARGSTYLNPPANFYRANRDAVTRAEATAQLFLGVRLQCAQCHNHPFDRWTQDDYYGWAGVFSRVQYKVLENRRTDSNDQHEFKGEQIVYLAKSGEMKNPRTHKAAPPRFLGAGETDPIRADDPTASVAEWITSPKNKLFARSQANRIWFHLMGRGIVDPIDDFRPTNPASNPDLLEALAADFVEHKFDLRHLIGVIMASSTYQLSAEPNQTNDDDEANFSRALVRRLSAEQLLDCQSEVMGVPTKFDGFPAGTRAAQLPGAREHRKENKMAEQFLDVFGKPPRLLTCECERSTETSMGQAFQLISGPAINSMLSDPKNRLTDLGASGKSTTAIVEQLYWSALSRAPSASEFQKTARAIDLNSNRRAALEDLAWALLNSKEFVLRR